MSILRALIIVASLAMATSPAWAGESEHEKPEREHKGGAKGAPEIDAAGLGSAAALLVGGAFLIAPRRRRRRQGA